MPEIKLLVSYAGRKEGNYGYIYQATNWEYLGYFVSEGFWFVDGEERHLVTLWNRCKKHGKKELSFLPNLEQIALINLQRTMMQIKPTKTVPRPKPKTKRFDIFCTSFPPLLFL